LRRTARQLLILPLADQILGLTAGPTGTARQRLVRAASLEAATQRTSHDAQMLGDVLLHVRDVHHGEEGATPTVLRVVPVLRGVDVERAVREAVDVGHGGDEHLDADEEVLVGDYKFILIGFLTAFT